MIRYAKSKDAGDKADAGWTSCGQSAAFPAATALFQNLNQDSGDVHFIPAMSEVSFFLVPMMIVVPALAPGYERQKRIVPAFIAGRKILVSPEMPDRIDQASAVPKHGRRKKVGINDRERTGEDREQPGIGELDQQVIPVDEFMKRGSNQIPNRPHRGPIVHAQELRPENAAKIGAMRIFFRIDLEMMGPVNRRPRDAGSRKPDCRTKRSESFKTPRRLPRAMREQAMEGHAHPDATRKEEHHQRNRELRGRSMDQHRNDREMTKNLQEKKRTASLHKKSNRL